MRCPKCSKLFSVDKSDVLLGRPQFQCVQCSSNFWLQAPPPTGVDEVPTFLVGTEAGLLASEDALVGTDQNRGSEQREYEREDTEKTFTCPSCATPNVKGVVDCKFCGIVFSKFNSVKKSVATASSVLTPQSQISAGADLRRAWDKVMMDYENKEEHGRFLQMAVKTNSLRFASQQYRNLIDANPSDEIALQMRDKIIGIATMTFTPPRREPAKRFRFGVSGFVISMGILFLILGFLLPKLPKPVMAAGAGLVTIGFVFRLIKRKNKSRSQRYY